MRRRDARRPTAPSNSPGEETCPHPDVAEPDEEHGRRQWRLRPAFPRRCGSRGSGGGRQGPAMVEKGSGRHQDQGRNQGPRRWFRAAHARSSPAGRRAPGRDRHPGKGASINPKGLLPYPGIHAGLEVPFPALPSPCRPRSRPGGTGAARWRRRRCRAFGIRSARSSWPRRPAASGEAGAP